MHNWLVGIVLLVAIVSGTSKLLLLLACIFIIFLSIARLPAANFSFRVNHVSAVGASWFFILLALSIFSLPFENLTKFAMTLSSAILAALIVGNVSSRLCSSQVRIYTIVLGLILFGDLIHMAGLLGSDMVTYKSIVQFDTLSNIERESDIGVLGLRYHGWFAEPSYHGAFTGLLCALLLNLGVWRSTLLVALVLFILCPTPMMVLAFAAGILMGGRVRFLVMVRHPLVAFLAVTVSLSVSILFSSRLTALYSGTMGIISGETINTSETIRLVYPVFALLTHWASYGVKPESNNCLELATCLPESLKLPVITYLIFFGLVGAVTIGTLAKWLYRASFLRVLLALMIASVLSGGGGYVLQFNLIVALLLIVSVRNSSPGSAPFRRQVNILSTNKSLSSTAC